MGELFIIVYVAPPLSLADLHDRRNIAYDRNYLIIVACLWFMCTLFEIALITRDLEMLVTTHLTATHERYPARIRARLCECACCCKFWSKNETGHVVIPAKSFTTRRILCIS